MYVHETGSLMTVYIQNSYFAQKNQNDHQNFQSSDRDTEMDNYLGKVANAIPEVKAAMQAGVGIGFVILPNGASGALKQSVSQATSQMIEDGTDPNVLKDVVGVVKGTWSGDVEGANGIQTSKNDTFSYDTNDVKNILDKLKDSYGSNDLLNGALAKFANYIDDIWSHLSKDLANNDSVSIFTPSGKTSLNEKKGQILSTSV